VMYGRRNPYGSGGHGDNLRPHRLSLKAYAAVGTVQWAAQRRATRLTPFLMALGYFPGTPLAMYLPVPWEVLAMLGVLCTLVTTITALYAMDDTVDRQESNRQARQWALRTASIPVALTGYLLTVQEMHARDMDVINWAMLLAYCAGCTLLWLYLFTAGHSGGKRLREQMTRSWLGRTIGTSLEGSKLLRRRKLAHGTEVELDITATGRRASQLTGSDVREEVAARMSLPVERVLIKPNPKDAGKIKVQIMDGTQFAKEIPHPLAPRFPITRKGEMGSARSILEPIAIGVDPQEMNAGKGVILHQLYTLDGFQHLVVVAGTGGGKSTLVNSLIEHMTAANDVDVVLCDPVKGHHAQAWQFAVARTHLGPDAAWDIVHELERAASLIGARSKHRRTKPGAKSATFLPTKDDRALCVVLDEADGVLKHPDRNLRRRAEAAVQTIMSKGRSEGVGIILIAQRGTMNFLGASAGDIKANAYSRIVMGVSQTSEMHWMLPGWEALGIPDMSAHGFGAPGVFVQSVGKQWRTGRAYGLYEPEVIEAIALERCFLMGDEAHTDAMWRYLIECAEAEEEVGFLPGSKLSAHILEHGVPELGSDGEPVDSAAHLERSVPKGPEDMPTWGTPDSPALGELVGEAVDASSRAARATAYYAQQAAERGPVPLEALHVEGATAAPSVPPEFWDVVLQLAVKHGSAGVARRHLMAALEERLGDQAPKPTTVNGLLKTCQQKGWLSLVDKGSASVWHVTKGAPGTEPMSDAA
jgi:hypothetical protein